jgi:hypothetical protein
MMVHICLRGCNDLVGADRFLLATSGESIWGGEFEDRFIPTSNTISHSLSVVLFLYQLIAYCFRSRVQGNGRGDGHQPGGGGRIR